MVFLVLVVYVSVVANNLQPANHLAYGEESQNLCKNNCICGPLLTAAATDLVKDLGPGTGRYSA